VWNWQIMAHCIEASALRFLEARRSVIGRTKSTP
jgi:hypothetical protein